jgi:hypothetical protein
MPTRRSDSRACSWLMTYLADQSEHVGLRVRTRSDSPATSLALRGAYSRPEEMP